MAELSEQQLQELQQIFDDCDKNDNDRIGWDEFCYMLDKLTGEKDLKDKSTTFDLVDTNHSGAISFDEFCAWWSEQM